MKFSWQALVTKIAGGALIGLAPILGGFYPKQSLIFQAIFGSTGMVVLIAGMFVQSSQPANKLTDDAVAVNAAGAVTGANVTTTTTAPINAPYQQKGP